MNPFLADRMARPGEINGDALDRFTLAHYAFGVLLGAGRAPWWSVPLVAVSWEALERPMKRAWPRVFPHSSQDSWPNMIGDALAVLFGWLTFRAVSYVADRRSR
jgi:hypothetical protein